MIGANGLWSAARALAINYFLVTDHYGGVRTCDRFQHLELTQFSN
jgi:hypothetical protein